jgi:hypothetical protein
MRNWGTVAHARRMGHQTVAVRERTTTESDSSQLCSCTYPRQHYDDTSKLHLLRMDTD